MTRLLRIMSLSAVAVLLAPAAWAQYPSAHVGFNDDPHTTDPTAHEMFRIPEWSGSTVSFVVPNTSSTSYDFNNAFRSNAHPTEGAAALNVFFQWVDKDDLNAWCRLTTFGGQIWPNPSLNLKGKVYFKIINVGELFDGGGFGICLGIRETGVNVPQLANGGSTGDIEWVGASGVVLDPNDPNGPPLRPIPAYTLPLPFPQSTKSFMFDLDKGEVWVNSVKQPGTNLFQRFTGDGVLSAPNDRGTLECIAIVNTGGALQGIIDFHLDDLYFDSPLPDPVVPPTVVPPLIKDDVQVSVTDFLGTADMVSLHLNGDPNALDTLPIDPNDPNDDIVEFTIAPAVAGDVYTARQHDSLTGQWSAQSTGVTVLPAAAPFGMSFVLDEDGNGCNYTDPGGGWEFVGATSKLQATYIWPDGQLIYNDSSQWQTIDFPLDDPNVVTAWLGGNGQVDPSPSGFYQTDSIWFNSPPGGVPGPHEIYLDAVQVLDPNGAVIETFHDFEDGLNYITTIRGQSNTSLSSTALSTATSYDGTTSQRLVWTYDPNDLPAPAIGILTRLGSCGTNPQFDASGTTVRFHILARSQVDPNSPAIPVVVGPIVAAQDSVRIENDAAATDVQLYVNGSAVGSPVAAGTPTDFTSLVLNVGDSISATQTIGGVPSDFAIPRVVSAAPNAPVVSAPIAPGATTVTITGLYTAQFNTAALVLLKVNGSPAGSAVPSGASVDVTPTVTLVTGDLVTATQWVNGSESPLSAAVTVAYTAPVIYAPPSATSTDVTILRIDTASSSVTLRVTPDPNDPGAFTDYTDTPTPGLDSIDFDLTGVTLAAGYQINAYYTVGGIDSVLSDYEIVTTDVVTDILSPSCDDFESYADQAAMELVWTQVGTVPVELNTDKNATCTGGGTQSVRTPPGASYMKRVLPLAIPTEENPIVFNVNMYDPYGPNPPVAFKQWAELNANGGGPDLFYMHIGAWVDLGLVQDRYHLRALYNGGPGWVNLDEYDAPLRSIGWHTFTYIHKGNRIDVYVDGLLSLKNLQLTAETTFSQTEIGGGNWGNAATIYFDDLCVEMGPVRMGCIGPQAPAAPVISAPIEVDDNVVTVTGVDSSTLLLQVLDGVSIIGTAVGPFDPNDGGVVNVGVAPPLVHLHSITAEATNTIGTTASDAFEVGKGNGDIRVCLGIRETADALPLGSEGGTTGQIEWLGTVGTLPTAGGAPIGQPLSPSSGWVTMTFTPGVDDVTTFTGDGALSSANGKGTLEHLAISVDPNSPDRSTGQFDLYVDNVINVGADTGGADFVIEDFEGYVDGDQVLFQEPTYSGTTAGDLAPLPSASEVTSTEGNPGSSEWLVWFFRDTTDERWARITTSGVAFTSRPVIDLTKPIKLDLLLSSGGGCPNSGVSGNFCTADIDGSGDCLVQLNDLAKLLSSYGVDAGGDIDGDLDTDLQDLAALLAQYGDNCN